ncbi:LGFP repeat-containing protein [Yinghuangia sp. YIM S10712]|uniref:LGFP repeat-containing protein n=1 Tax=Yinghuangia sp. YIM S10712 TaxID=3436930 RepID=UPI003F52D009
MAVSAIALTLGLADPGTAEANEPVVPNAPTRLSIDPVAKNGSGDFCGYVGWADPNFGGVRLSAEFRVPSDFTEKLEGNFKLQDLTAEGAPVTDYGWRYFNGNNVDQISMAVGMLEDGHTYRWTAQGRNQGLYSPVSGCTFTIDRTGPGAPTITSTDFLPTGSVPSRVSQGGTGTFRIAAAPGSESSVECFSVLVNSSTYPVHMNCESGLVARPTNGVATLNFPADTWGTNSISVAAVEKSGNFSWSKRYMFYVPYQPIALTWAHCMTFGGKQLCGPILDRYLDKDAEYGPLGLPATGTNATPDGAGRYAHFTNGRTSLYWTEGTGVHLVKGAIRDKWSRLGWERGPLGYPITDELTTPDGRGRYTHFQHGSIYWTPETGAREIHGGIRDKWAQLRWEKGPLGYPVTDELTAPDGRGKYTHFQRGSIYWTPETGAHEIHGSIRDRWAAMGWERSPLGYPVTDEMVTPDGRGRYTHFQYGSIYWTLETGAHEVYGSIRNTWAAQGWERGQLGYPTHGEYTPAPGQRRSDFQGGYVIWFASNGTTRTYLT